ncbi:MAG: hypothetical protein KDC33_11455 [Thermoleophilia bacterium]|nr:hypothetical protein [Thermoleophilia bacterium]
MTDVSYQAILGGDANRRAPRFAALGDDAIATPAKKATKSLTVAVSKKQRAWLDQVAAESGRGIDRDAVVRALIDLGRELDVDWALLAGDDAMRAAVRHSVRVRRADREI